MTKPNSAMMLFMKHTPNVLEGLFDQCISGHCDTEQINGKIFYDFFLFLPPKEDSNFQLKDTGELTLPQILISNGKQRLLTHPLFETFIKVGFLFKIFLSRRKLLATSSSYFLLLPFSGF